MASPPTVGPRPRRDRFLVVSLLVLIAGVTGTARQAPQAPKDPSAAPSFADLGALLASLPNPAPPRFDEPRAQWFAAPPLACLDDLQARPTSRPYFWEASYKPVDGYDKVRAFYGCGDWHSAVNATWTIVKVLRQFPEISTGRLIREKLNDHLGASNFEGEVAYFKDAGAFERPYGYACLLALQSELQTWDDPQAAQWAAHMAPLTKFFSEQLVAYLKDLDRPVRTGGQTNTAVVLLAMLDASETLHDFALRSAAVEYAKKSYAKDTDCATEAEPAAGDLVSPCLAEAAVMSRVLDTAAFVPWLDAFLPAAVSPKFKPLLATSTAPVARQGGAGAAADAAQTTGGRSTPPAAASSTCAGRCSTSSTAT